MAKNWYSTGSVYIKEFVREMASNSGLSIPVCTAAYKAFIDVLSRNICEQRTVVLAPIGTFKLSKKKAVCKRLPTGVMTFVQEQVTLYFVATTSFKKQYHTAFTLHSEESQYLDKDWDKHLLEQLPSSTKPTNEELGNLEIEDG